MNNIATVVLVLFPQMFQYSDFFLCLSVESFLISDHL